MRTGAIFARGSCRALKWMALFGVVFAVGAGSAAAQAPTFTGAEWTPERDHIKINMSAAVWSRSPDDAAEDFTVSWGTGPDAMEATGTTSNIPGSRSGAKTEFMITLDKVVPTGAGGADGATGITVAYTKPDADDVNDRGILDNSAAHEEAETAASITVAENTTVAPTVPAVAPMTFKKGDPIKAFQLPEAKGNAPFTYIPSNLPPGLTWDADGADDASSTADEREDDRMIAGTPSAVTNEAHAVTYTVTDRDGQATSTTVMITVHDVPAKPDMPMVTATNNTSGSLDVMWDQPADNNSDILYYEVQHKATDAMDWVVPNTRVVGRTRETFTELTNGTSYDFQVRAINAVGDGPWSDIVMGTPMMSEAVPDAPGTPTVTAGGRGELVVSWAAPDPNGSTITSYQVQYWMEGEDRRRRDGVQGTTTTLTDLGDSMEYMVQVRAVSNNGDSPWSEPGTGTTMAAPVPADVKGQVTAMTVVGASVEEKTIGGTKRVHVPEGATDVMVSMTVQWTHAEITALYGGGTTAPKQWIHLQIQGDEPGDQIHVLPEWVSWIDDQGDVDFPNSQTAPENRGRLGGYINFDVPAKPKATEFPNSTRHSRSSTDTVRLLIRHDEDEAENDAFYIDATSSRDVDLNAGSAVNRTTPLIVIEDDEDQKVTVKKGRSSGPTEVYESDESVSFTVAATPPRLDLPLDVRLDMLDLSGVTVSAAEISLSDTSLELTPAANSANVTVHLPATDGNREDDEYELQASVSLYSLASGGFDTIPVASHAITVMDVHKLPEVSVSAASDSVAEGEEVELTVTINRNPANTIAVDPEKRQYTSEPIEVMLTAGAGTTASMGDYTLPATIEFDEHNKKAPWTQTMKVKVMVLEDDDLDDGEMLVLDAMVAGTKTENGDAKMSYAGVSSLTIEEGTGKLVWARSREEVEAAVMAAKQAGMGDDMMFTAGEMIELEGNDLFGSAEGVAVGYTAMVEGDAVFESVSGGMVTITADSMGMAKVTITARASRPSGAVVINDQTDPREASITIALEVGVVALSIELSGPEDMNIVEGGMGGMVTATANRAVTEDTVVNLMRDRAMSSAEDADFTAEPITIMAGQTTGSTRVMAVADDMMENEGNMAEELVLYGMAADNAGEVTGHVKFYIWDAAVPALPVIAQLLLAALMAVGGYRRYRRR